MVVEEGVVLIFPPLIFDVAQEFLHILEHLLPTQWCFRSIAQFERSYCLSGSLPNGGGHVLLRQVVGCCTYHSGCVLTGQRAILDGHSAHNEAPGDAIPSNIGTSCSG